jgi:ribonuclease J
MTEAEGDELLFVPLGGAGEIGMNLNLYGYGPRDRHQWLMIDLGVTFGDGSLPGVRVIMPDPTFIEEKGDDLLGIVLTHAHEDHLGAVPYLWKRLRCPVYATPFTASVLRRKLAYDGKVDVDIREIPLNARFTVGPFDLELITLTHSIPEPNGIALRTPAGLVLHTGDWKFDPAPVTGPVSDVDALRRLGDEGVLAIVCDSTNVFTPGTSGSEADLLENLTRVIARSAGKVAVTCFASNIARLETIAAAAAANDRNVVLAGPALWRFNESARENGYLANTPAFISDDDAGYLPRDKTLVICTGSQGEAQAALYRIASGSHPRVNLEEGDTVIFSSRIIPGNEVAVSRVLNLLATRHIEAVTWEDELVHVSGHPARDELIQMYGYARPQIAVPVHGERRHLMEHARLAEECQVGHTIVVENGAIVRLDGGQPGIVDQAPFGRLYVEGNKVVSENSNIVRERNRVTFNGAAMATVVFDRAGYLVAEPQMATIGLIDEKDQATADAVIAAIQAALDDVPRKRRKDDKFLREAVRLAIRRTFRDICGKRPETKVHLVRTQEEQST